MMWHACVLIDPLALHFFDCRLVAHVTEKCARRCAMRVHRQICEIVRVHGRWEIGLMGMGMVRIVFGWRRYYSRGRC